METAALAKEKDDVLASELGLSSLTIPKVPSIPQLPTLASPVGRTFVVMCVAAAMNFIFFPHAVLDRLSELETSFVVDTAMSLVEAVTAASERTGLPDLFDSLRQDFLRETAG